MSIELNIYANRPVLTRETLVTECASPDLPEELRWEVRFVDLDLTPDADQSGELAEDQRVAGWTAGARRAAEFRDAFARNDAKAIKQLAQDDEFAVVDLLVRTPKSDDWDALNEPDFLESIPQEHRAAVRAATSWYTLETQARRTAGSVEFQLFLWRMIGVLTYGIIEDPQEGEIESCAEEPD